MAISEKSLNDPPVGILAFLCFIVLAHNQHKIKKANLYRAESPSIVPIRGILFIYVIICIAMLWNFLAIEFEFHFGICEFMVIIDFFSFSVAPIYTICSSVKMLARVSRPATLGIQTSTFSDFVLVSILFSKISKSCTKS